MDARHHLTDSHSASARPLLAPAEKLLRAMRITMACLCDRLVAAFFHTEKSSSFCRRMRLQILLD